MSVDVKICGINDAVSMQTAIESGARFVGLVFYAPSPRAVTIDAARELAAAVPPAVRTVGLFVDPKDRELLATIKKVPLRIIQLHGDETPERVTEIKKLTKLPVMKAIKIATKYDLKSIPAYEAVADWLLFDAKASDSILPGGNAKVFDWSLLKGITPTKPWMLAGGLNVENLAEAVRVTGARTVDVSSGVEDAPGRKNPDKIRELIALARRL